MTLGELIATTPWAEVQAVLPSLVPDGGEALDGYREVFLLLKRRSPVPGPMRICIQEAPHPDPEDLEAADDGHPPTYEVVGKDGTLNRDREDFEFMRIPKDDPYAVQETAFSLALTPWDHWLGMAVDEGTMQRWTAAQVVAHVLYEMTFHGFEEGQVSGMREELSKRLSEVHAMNEEERAEQLISLEEVIERTGRKRQGGGS